MFCNYCGSVNPDDSVFCSKCGRSIAKTSAPPPSAEAPSAPQVQSVAPLAEEPSAQVILDEKTLARFAENYSRMADDELLRLKGEPGVLRPEARKALALEIARRDIQNDTVPDDLGPKYEGVGGWLSLSISHW